MRQADEWDVNCDAVPDKLTSDARDSILLVTCAAHALPRRLFKVYELRNRMLSRILRTVKYDVSS